MELTPLNKPSVNKPQIEQVQKEKQEYKLINSFIRTKGLNLYGYNKAENRFYLVQEDNSDTIHWEEAKELVNRYTATVDSRDIFFEALNDKSAEKRIIAWQQGKKELDNLKYTNGKIDIFNP